MMNETLQVIAKRYSCRSFKPDMPSDELLHAIAKAAVQAPSAVNRQPWRVIVVKNKALIRDMEEAVVARLKTMEDPTAYQRILARGGHPYYGAPCMIVVAIQPSEYALIDCGILVENIALAATSLGVANVICGMTRLAFEGGRGAEFARRLGIPDSFVFGSSVLLGYADAAKDPHAPDLEKISFVE